ncbi:MAG: serine hydrolase domain-containing protein [Actinomycetota bacterium]
MYTIDGDEALAAEAQAVLGKQHDVVGVAAVTPDGTRTAALGTTLDRDFEIGSISKGVTGTLYHLALERGEVTPSTKLGELLPLADSPVAGVTLAALAVHRSGLPRMQKAAQPWRRSWEMLRHGTNPFRETLPELLQQARGVPLGAPKARYSNLGFELLGHALAAAAGTSHAALVQDRIAGPLGLGTFYVAASPVELRPTALPGRSRRGGPREAFTGEGVGPAGGIRSSVGDMAALASALLDGTAPGAQALEPVSKFGQGVRIGAAWLVVEVKGRTVTWHNGGTGGFRSWMGMDRDAGTAAVVLSARSVSVDGAGMRLLAGLRES